MVIIAHLLIIDLSLCNIHVVFGTNLGGLILLFHAILIERKSGKNAQIFFPWERSFLYLKEENLTRLFDQITIMVYINKTIY